MIRGLLQRLRRGPAAPPPAPLPSPEPLEIARLPVGTALVDARSPCPDLAEGAIPFPAEILFFHLSKLPESLAVVAETPLQARRIVRRLRQCGKRAWVWTGPAPLRPCPHRGRWQEGWWVYAETGKGLVGIQQDESGLWIERSWDFPEAGPTA